MKKQRHHFADKGPYKHSYGFSSSHVWMWELDHKEGWAPKKWYFRIVALEKTLKSPLDFKDIEPVNPKRYLNIHWKDWWWSWSSNTLATWCEELLIGKDPDAGKDWRWEEKGTSGWDGWMASLTQWTWVWASSGSWWWTGRPGVLQSMGSQRAEHTEQQHCSFVCLQDTQEYVSNTIRH